MPVSLTQEDIDKIKRVQIRNITEKLKSGKPLSVSEMKQLDELKEGGGEVSSPDRDFPAFTKSDKVMRQTIQRKCGISERKAYDWIARFKTQKTKSKGWNVSDILAQVMERQAKAVSGPNADLKREELEEKIRILRIRRRELEGQFVTIQEMNDSVISICRVLTTGLAEFEARASAEYPTEPRMVEIAQTISDRVKRTVQSKLKQTGEEDE